MSKPISQREARRLRKRVAELERKFDQQNERWRSDWPGSTRIHRNSSVDTATQAVVNTARALRHAVVVTMDGDNLIFWGVQP